MSEYSHLQVELQHQHDELTRLRAELAATKARLEVARVALEKIANGQTTKPWGNVVAREALESIALDAPAGDAGGSDGPTAAQCDDILGRSHYSADTGGKESNHPPAEAKEEG